MKIQKSVKIITILGQISHFESSFPSHPLPHCWLGSLSRWLRGGHWGGAAGMWSGRPRGAPPPSRSTCRPRCNLQFHPARGKSLIIVLQDKNEALPTGWMKKRQFWSTLSEGVELMTETQNRVELLSPELVKFSSLKNLPILSNHRNFRQNWWQKKHKIWWNYCGIVGEIWWNYCGIIGENFGENSIENSNHQNFRQNWWKFWRKFNRKWMWSPTSTKCNFTCKCDFTHKWSLSTWIEILHSCT